MTGQNAEGLPTSPSRGTSHSYEQLLAEGVIAPSGINSSWGRRSERVVFSLVRSRAHASAWHPSARRWCGLAAVVPPEPYAEEDIGRAEVSLELLPAPQPGEVVTASDEEL